MGGSGADFELVRPVLEALGRPHHVGGVGVGAATKLAVNLTIVTAMAVIGESLAIGGALGVSREVMLDSLADSPLGGLAKRKRALIEAGEFPPQFTLRLAAKDLRLADLADLAATAAGLRTPVTGAVRRWLDEAELAGAGGLDFAALVALICREGRSLRQGPSTLAPEGSDRRLSKALAPAAARQTAEPGTTVEARQDVSRRGSRFHRRSPHRLRDRSRSVRLGVGDRTDTSPAIDPQRPRGSPASARPLLPKRDIAPDQLTASQT